MFFVALVGRRTVGGFSVSEPRPPSPKVQRTADLVARCLGTSVRKFETPGRPRLRSLGSESWS